MSDTETEAPDETETEDTPVSDDPGVAEEEGQPDDDGEPTPEPDAPSPSSETTVAELDKRATALSRRGVNYKQSVIEYLQETEQPLVQCGFCLADLPGFFPSPHVQPFTPDQLAFARAVLGMPDEPPYVQGNDAHMCSDCNGWGTVLTGAKRNDQKTRKCFTCGGLGWEGRGSGDIQAGNGAANLTIVTPEQAPPDVADHDPWGRPAGHPGFNQLPVAGMPAHLLPPGMAAVNPL